MKNSWYDHILVIDRAIWRCGAEGPFKHGWMNTLLHNEKDGMMCCLGQACLQSGVTKEKMGKTVSPFYVSQFLPKDSYLLKDFLHYKTESDFANQAMIINDEVKLSRSGRELSLFLLGKRHRIWVRFTGSYTDGWSS